ncbi:MAG: tRNA (adenosine(37)-N6)-dimethylallyltransferase MiaA [Lachnospiraceae bacterium]|nr:tRNA (adenosine(37)-N6)-dimethylallyltransferase MiaA [Lachnospiraceae bacterium]
MTDAKSKIPVIVLTGPTGVGKTALSIKLAKELDGEIISADSVQVYRGLDIGSAKIKESEKEGIPHHLIDICDADEEFNVFKFKTLCDEAIKDIYERGHYPIICGGTGFYIQSVLRDVDFKADDSAGVVRKKYEDLYEEKGTDYLYDLLIQKDPEAATYIHKNNVKRVIRALEYFELNNAPISQHNEEQRDKENVYDSLYFVLTDERSTLYDNINKRVDKMVEEGLMDEVKRLMAMKVPRSATSMQALGYKEIYDAFLENTDMGEAIEKIKLNTRHFAKRQLTWFRREKDVIMIDKSEFDHDEDKMLQFILKYVKGY